MTQPINRYYYINNETKKIVYFLEELSEIPEGFVLAGMSGLPIKGAAGYYAKNQPGFTVIDGDKAQKEADETSTASEEE